MEDETYKYHHDNIRTFRRLNIKTSIMTPYDRLCVVLLYYS